MPAGQRQIASLSMLAGRLWLDQEWQSGTGGSRLLHPYLIPVLSGSSLDAFIHLSHAKSRPVHILCDMNRSAGL